MSISPAESLVMEALWRRQPLTAEELFAELGPGQGWAEGTLKTLLARLHKKGVVSAEKDGRRFLYRPLTARADQDRGTAARYDRQIAAKLAQHSIALNITRGRGENLGRCAFRGGNPNPEYGMRCEWLPVGHNVFSPESGFPIYPAHPGVLGEG